MIIIIFAVAAFLEGVMCFGVYYIPKNHIGIKTHLWGGEKVIIYGEGIAFAFPITYRIVKYPITGSVSLINYKFGNFYQRHAINGKASDQYDVEWNVIMDYVFDFNQASSLVNRFENRLPLEILEYETRRAARLTFSKYDNTSFRDKTICQQIMNEISALSLEELAKRKIILTTLRLTPYQENMPGLVKPPPEKSP
ncbi:MAG: hypothetical protein A2161_02640 [Candidatus Schekmanbacteria bacterium RBG_13_48_7]|uniref:Band 7 domain-containing protein n=1 Tax=Candidatus Schekmanbacteria bacterium RBG_13_48_7 TaxID=1817878 RepID=A0A1F7S4C8_9BACT|nr:MAG: hypothetical protein A2161_02640 [Candidatus Schekmanbacteria bacterium RBG_13_48_7]